jgi:hypothetical protein
VSQLLHGVLIMVGNLKANLVLSVAVASLLGSSGCSEPTIVDESDFDQTCSVNSDCIRVGVGSICCLETQAAISVSAEDDYLEAISERGNCPQEEAEDACGLALDLRGVACVNGQCELSDDEPSCSSARCVGVDP